MCVYKKRLGTILFMLLFALMVFIPVSAASSSLEGPKAVRAGDSLTLHVRVNGSSLRALQGKITFNTNQLTYKGHSNLIKKWDMDIAGSGGEITFLGVTEDMSLPINGLTRIFSLTFIVNSSLATGAKISISTTPISASDGNLDSTIPSSTYSVSVSPALSTNNRLQSLSVKGFTLSPSFSDTVTKYSLQVPYATSSLSVSAVAADSHAKVSVSGTKLSVGKNTVTIRVTAANGGTRSYVITATREQDPDYAPNGDARLKSIAISQGILSPTFSPDGEQYVVYVPYEITEITLRGEHLNAKSQPVKGSQATLVVGDNPMTITGVAENGSQKTYTIIVRRMELYEGTNAQSLSTITNSGISESSKIENNVDGSSSQPEEYTHASGKRGLPLPLLVAAGALILLIVGTLLFALKRKDR